MSSHIIGTAKTGTPPAIGGLQGKLPQYKTVANTSQLRGRVGVPVNLQPKYTVAKPPYGATKPRLTPFVQRYWRRTFFWVAVAGLGYVTVPEDYYDRFVTFINGDDPDYEEAIALLSLAAVRDDDEGRVRYPMPAGATYRLKAPAVPAQLDLPVLPSMAGNSTQRGRIGVPENLRPKMTLFQAPSGAIRDRLFAFIQRPWKHRFVWVAVAGLGYVTVPEESYARFREFVNRDEPDYEGAIGVLSVAAARDEEQAREHFAMPPGATYRYRAPVAPLDQSKSSEACSFEPFIERKWNRVSVWVLIPQTGNVTVPEDYYDRFYGFVSSEPPDFQQACAILAEAAANDTIVPASPNDMATQQTASGEACGLSPFVERKWNRAFVWVLIPQTGNVTVPEDLFDRFYGLVSSDPPNYQGACTVLLGAAASDTVAVASSE